MRYFDVVVVVITTDDSNTFERAIQSIFRQKTTAKIGVLVLGMNNSDSWESRHDSILTDSSVIYHKAEMRRSYDSRNLAMKLAEEYFPPSSWLCRLDHDDYLFGEASIEEVWSRIRGSSRYYWALSGNLQICTGKVLSHPNLPSAELIWNPESLLHRLRGMVAGDSSLELPSCNLWLRNCYQVYYPPFKSAEDHWLVTQLILNEPKAGIILDDVIFSVYSLSG